MSLIPSKRMQQGIFEALASQNKAAGSGGGSGLSPSVLAGSAANGSAALIITTTNPTTYTLVTGVTTTFQANRTGLYRFSFVCTAKTTGTGTYSYGYLFLDGAKVDINLYPNAVFDKGCVGYVCNSGDLQMLLAVGSHTLDFRVSTDNNTTNWLNYNTFIYAYCLSAA